MSGDLVGEAPSKLSGTAKQSCWLHSTCQGAAVEKAFTGVQNVVMMVSSLHTHCLAWVEAEVQQLQLLHLHVVEVLEVLQLALVLAGKDAEVVIMRHVCRAPSRID